MAGKIPAPSAGVRRRKPVCERLSGGGRYPYGEGWEGAGVDAGVLKAQRYGDGETDSVDGEGTDGEGAECEGPWDL